MSIDRILRALPSAFALRRHLRALPSAFALRRHLRALPSAFALRRHLLTLLEHPIFRPGIAVRLGIAFVAVALLAVAANLIVEHGVSVIQTTTVRSAPPPIVVKEPAAAPAPVLAAAPAAVPVPIPTPARAELLLAAVVEFERAVERRGETSNAANSELLRAAEQRLHEEMSTFVEKADVSSDRASLKKLATRATALHRDGEEI